MLWRESSLGLILLSLLSIEIPDTADTLGICRHPLYMPISLLISSFCVLVFCWSPPSQVYTNLISTVTHFYMFFSRNMSPPVFRQNEHIVDAMVKERVVSMAVHHDWGFVAILLDIAQGLPVDRTLHSFWWNMWWIEIRSKRKWIWSTQMFGLE